MVWITEKMDGWIKGCNWLLRIGFHELALEGPGLDGFFLVSIIFKALFSCASAWFRLICALLAQTSC